MLAYFGSSTGSEDKLIGLVIIVIVALIIVGIIILIAGFAMLMKQRKQEESYIPEESYTPVESYTPRESYTPVETYIPEETSKIIEPEATVIKETSSIRYGAGFEKEPEVEHVCERILFCASPENVWICPVCETENSNSVDICEVCHCTK